MELSPKSSFEELLDSTQAYSKTSLEIAKLKGLNSTAKVVSTLAARLLLVISIIIFTVILSIAIALWLNVELDKPYYGFFIVAAFYFVLSILMYFFLPKIITKPVSNIIISEALD